VNLNTVALFFFIKIFGFFFKEIRFFKKYFCFSKIFWVYIIYINTKFSEIVQIINKIMINVKIML